VCATWDGGPGAEKGTPTMGGIIILLSILIPTYCLPNLDKVYIRLMVLCTVWLGVIGFLDDLFKIVQEKQRRKSEAYTKKDSDGLGRYHKDHRTTWLGIIIGVHFIQHAVTVEGK